MDKAYFLALAKKPAVVVGAASVASAAAGVFVGYKVAEKRLRASYELRMEQEIAETKRYYSEARVVQPPKPSPQDLVAETIIQEQGYSGAGQFAAPIAGDTLVSEDGTLRLSQVAGDKDPISEANVESQPINDLEQDVTGRQRENLFAGTAPAEDDWNWEFETKIRAENPDKAYILHHDEFYENETDYEQVQLTYYEGDDTLVDDKDMPVPDEDSVVGEDALTSFGHGSKDKNVVFVRNDKLELDIEVVRSNGKYSVEVLGLDDTENELKHSYSRPGRKFRQDRDD